MFQRWGQWSQLLIGAWLGLSGGGLSSGDLSGGSGGAILLTSKGFNFLNGFLFQVIVYEVR